MRITERNMRTTETLLRKIIKTHLLNESNIADEDEFYELVARWQEYDDSINDFFKQSDKTWKEFWSDTEGFLRHRKVQDDTEAFAKKQGFERDALFRLIGKELGDPDFFEEENDAKAEMEVRKWDAEIRALLQSKNRGTSAALGSTTAILSGGDRAPFVPEWEKSGWGPSDPFPARLKSEK